MRQEDIDKAWGAVVGNLSFIRDKADMLRGLGNVAALEWIGQRLDEMVMEYKEESQPNGE